MRFSDRRRRFRSLLEGTACIHPGSVFDPISARIAEDLGFEAAMLGGSVASLAVLGAPDLIVMTSTELAALVSRITRACSIPLMVDADHGFGNALNVARTVEELETAGCAALTIEDTDLPTPYGSSSTRLIPVEEAVGKIRAALAARQAKSLVIVGRTDAAAAGRDGLAARVKAFAAAGADAVFASRIKDRADIESMCAAVNVPVMLGNIPTDLADRNELARLGVRVALTGHQPFAAAMQAAHDTLKALREGNRDAMPKLPSDQSIKQWTRDAAYRRSMRDFLDSE